MNNNQITFSQWIDFITEFWHTTKNMRLGQAFCNKFNIQDSYLFYETKYNLAADYIWSNYIIAADKID